MTQFEFSHRTEIEVFEWEGEEYGFNGSDWLWYVGDSIEYTYDIDLVTKLNQMYKEWRESGKEY
jgi:hypothetical protein